MSTVLHEAVLSLGSNTADRRERMAAAIGFAESLGCGCRVSEIYETPALNGRDAAYLNAVAFVSTSLERAEVEALAKEWERKCGRLPEHKALGRVCIDVDLVVWDSTVLRPSDFGRGYFSRGYSQLVALAGSQP